MTTKLPAGVKRFWACTAGLGLDVHERIRNALENVPTYEQQLDGHQVKTTDIGAQGR